MKSIKISIPSLIENIKIIESFIDNAKENFEINDDIYGNIMISVTECISNAIIHGNSMHVAKEVKLEFYETEDGFGFRICDEGTGFDHSHLPDPTSPENIEKENGRGIFLMRNLADEVLFNERGNEVSVFFN